MGIEQILERLVRIGTVSSLDSKGKRVRVKYEDTDTISGWLYVLQHSRAGIYVAPDGEHTHTINDTYSNGGTASTEPSHKHDNSYLTFWMPQVNDTVVVLNLPVADGDGFVLGAF